MTRSEIIEKYSRFYIPIKQTSDCLIIYITSKNYEHEVDPDTDFCFYPTMRFNDQDSEVPRLELPFKSPLDTKLGVSLYGR